MSRLTPLTKNLTDLYNIAPQQKMYQYKKINTHKFNGLSTNSYSAHNSHTQKHKFQNNFQTEKNYAQKLFNDSENNNIPQNRTNSKNNININTSTIINQGNNNEEQNALQNYITINDIIGEKCELNLDILNLFFENFDQCKTSKKTMGLIKSYGVNTYQGIVRNYNEDRVSIIINMNKPKNYLKKWPKISFFGIYDGHGGEGCAEYLRDNLHKLICENDFFPDNIPEAIEYGITRAEYDFLNNYALSPNKEEILDKSGSCALIILIVDSNIFVANVGDSRCLLSMDNGNKYLVVTKDHKPNLPNEMIRIKKSGGNIYQSQTLINNLDNTFLNGKILIGPYRVIPGRLSVCRTIGDAESKLQKFGGNPNVIISTPDIFFYDLKKENLDFFILGCDGIYDQMSNKEILDLAWMVLRNKFEQKENGLNALNENNNINELNDIHYKSGLIVDLILKSSLARKSFDNVTCLFVGFKDFLPEPPNGIDSNINNNELNSNNNINIKGKINPAFSGITPQKLIGNINSNGGIMNDSEEKGRSDKIYTIKKKSNILNKKSLYQYSVDKNKMKTNRNEKRKILLNNNRVNRIFNTESKLNSFLYSEQLLEDKNNAKIRTELNNNSEKKNFKKIHKRPHLTKENTNFINKENNNNNNKILNNKIQSNLMTYTKKNQSFNKNTKYLNNKTNTYKQINKKNIDMNTYNSFTIKKMSDQNTTRINNHSNLKDNFHIFKPISKMNKANQPFKLIDTKNSFSNNSKSNNIDNKSSIIINNMNHISIHNHKYINKPNERISINNDSNSTYLSFNNNLYNFDNSNRPSSKYKYQNKHVINNSNSTKINSFFNNKNITLKNPKKYISLNNNQNLTFESNRAFSISNNLMINRYINNAFTTKMKREFTSKLKQISTNKSFEKKNNNINNMNVSNPNISNVSMTGVKKPNYIYNYADKTYKPSYNYSYSNNLDNKSYKSFTYNSKKKKATIKYNNYLVTDLGKAKKSIFFDDNKKDIY